MGYIWKFTQSFWHYQGKKMKQNVHLKYFGVNKNFISRQTSPFFFFFPKVSVGFFPLIMFNLQETKIIFLHNQLLCTSCYLDLEWNIYKSKSCQKHTGSYSAIDFRAFSFRPHSTFAFCQFGMGLQATVHSVSLCLIVG